MVYDNATGIFEDSVLIHPNMNNIIISQFNNDRIQELIKINSFFGEILDADKSILRSLDRLSIIDLSNAVIQILSIREEFESLKLSFKFLNTDLANTIKKSYMDFLQSFTINARSFGGSETTSFYLVTFDLLRKNNY